jgi:arabinogalactan oligomer/maltooligosaccharide transport system permease protein
VFIAFALFPILYVASASLADAGTLTGSNRLFRAVTSANYSQLADTMFFTWAANTIEIAVAAEVGTVLMAAAAAYAFSRFRFAGRRVGLTALLIVQMFPQMLAFVAVFLLLLGIGNVFPALGLNSKLALICVYLGGALGANTSCFMASSTPSRANLAKRRRSTVPRTLRFIGQSSSAWQRRCWRWSLCSVSSLRSRTSSWRG